MRTAATGGLLLSDIPSNLRALLPPESSDDFSITEMNGTIPSVGEDESWDSVHQNFSALKGDLASMKMRIAEAERERNALQHAVAVKPPRPKSIFSSFKPKKFFQKLFFRKGLSSSGSSKESESPMPATGKASTRPRRHSIT